MKFLVMTDAGSSSVMSSHFGRAREQMMNDRGFYRGMDRDGNFWGRGRR